MFRVVKIFHNIRLKIQYRRGAIPQAQKLNKSFRIREDGQVYTSIRLTVVAACRMYLNHFPMDVQVCNLKAESFGYDTNDVIFEWLPKKPLDLASDLQETD